LEIRVGYELIYDCPQPTPMMLVLHIHYSRASDIIIPDHITTTPSEVLDATSRTIWAPMFSNFHAGIQ
jgi:hypothetical protein